MKKDGLMNSKIISEITKLGHTEMLCIADCGLPIPKEVDCIDVSVVQGIPTFLDVLDAVREELVIESFVLAEEIVEGNGDLLKEIGDRFQGIPYKTVTHEDFKEMTKNAKCIVRTGENSSYANILLVGGVNF